MIHVPTLGGGDTVGISELQIANFFNKTESVNQIFLGHCDVRDVALAHVRGGNLLKTFLFIFLIFFD